MGSKVKVLIASGVFMVSILNIIARSEASYSKYSMVLPTVSGYIDTQCITTSGGCSITTSSQITTTQAVNVLK